VSEWENSERKEINSQIIIKQKRKREAIASE
jgi:hypothetical protein